MLHNIRASWKMFPGQPLCGLILKLSKDWWWWFRLTNPKFHTAHLIGGVVNQASHLHLPKTCSLIPNLDRVSLEPQVNFIFHTSAQMWNQIHDLLMVTWMIIKHVNQCCTQFSTQEFCINDIKLVPNVGARKYNKTGLEFSLLGFVNEKGFLFLWKIKFVCLFVLMWAKMAENYWYTAALLLLFF